METPAQDPSATLAHSQDNPQRVSDLRSTEEHKQDATVDSEKTPIAAGDDAPQETPGYTTATSTSAAARAASPAAHASSPAPSAPQPKKFSSVTINRKFLEKNASGPGSSAPTTHTPTSKSTSSTPKPSLQTTVSLSRLVTTKLTAGPTSSATGTGWSRPSSTAPITPPAASANQTPLVNQANLSTATPRNGPQMPVVGKVIQPQPRNAVAPSVDLSAASSKHAWGAARAGMPAGQSADPEFPTAAEVAQVEASQHQEKKEASLAEVAKQEALQHEADAFRGVHLDPKAHHWDEMAEDDDNFLDGVIEFGDGRSYTVHPTASTSTSTGDAEKKDRWADDYDRSWPRSSSRQSNNLPTQRDLPPHADKLSSPNRSLYNERSNRLEHVLPSNSHAPNQGPHGPPRRDNRNEYAGPSRDGAGGVQLLQKPGEGGNAQPFRSRGMRTPSGRDMPPPTVPHAPGPPSDSGSAWGGRDAPPHGPLRSPTFEHSGAHTNRGRRLSNMGPPPPPLSLTSPSLRHRELDRQPPPHLAQQQQPARPPSSVRGTSRESTTRSTAPSEDVGLQPLRSPRVLPLQSPRLEAPKVLTPEFEAASKEAMHTAAERARLRRQQEEEERERERERARRKAEELAAKLGTSPKASRQNTKDEVLKSPATNSSEVLNILETAVKDAIPAKPGNTSSPDKHSVSRPLSQRPIQRAPLQAPSVADEAGSWRRKSVPPPTPPAWSQTLEPSSNVIKERPPTLDFEAPSLAVQPGEEIEELDFSEHGKLADIEQPATEGPQPHSHHELPAKPARPVASDFFEGEGPQSPREFSTPRGPPVSQPSAPTRQTPATEASSWRRRGPIEPVSTQRPENLDLPLVAPQPQEIQNDSHKSLLPPRPGFAGGTHHAAHQQQVHGHLRSPRSPTFREVSMSTLDDTLSRIRGAIDGMHDQKPGNGHAADSTKSIESQTLQEVPMPKWVPPSRRSQAINPRGRSSELAVTSGSTPGSPNSGAYKVNLPVVSVAHEPVPKKKLQSAKAPPAPVRWDILSFNPPVQGMNRQDLSVNSVLFKQDPPVRGKPMFRVALPVSDTENVSLMENLAGGNEVTVKLPSKAAERNRPREPSDSGSWQKGSATKGVPALDTGLDTVSRSPPPEVVLPDRKVAVNGASLPTHRAINGTTATQTEPVPKIIGFTVASELDKSLSDVAVGVAPTESVSTNPISATVSAAPITSATVETGSKKAAATTSPVRETSARLPDPDFLKAVWSQVPAGSDVVAANSLKNIADDMTSVPFTLQEVKSDDGTGTPPPAATPSRMSAAEVTRAFQTVPTQSSSSSTSTPPSGPSSAATPMTRKPSYNFTPGQNPNTPRPGSYPGYPSPMMNSPGPTVVYPPPNMVPSPVPRPMQLGGHPVPYGQPMWVPAQPGMAPQPGMGRGLPSPYPAQMMAYPSPGVQPMYHPVPGQAMTMMHAPGTPDGAGRGRVMPMISPVTPNAQGFAPSPVMMHAPPYPSPLTPGRGPHMQLVPQPSPRLPHAAPPMTYGAPPPAGYRPWQ